MSLKVADLFCGAGGLSLGLSKAGLDPVFAADWDSHSCSTYRQNLGSHVHCLDMEKFTVAELTQTISDSCGKLDVVAGGPPCQGFSVQGRGAPEDSRNDLFLKFGEVAVALRPRAILIENVPTVLGKRGAPYLGRVESELRRSGYNVYKSVLQAADYGVAQFRRRAFIVAIRLDCDKGFAFPIPKKRDGNYVTVREAIGSLPPPPDDFREHPEYANHRLVAISDINLQRLRHVPEGGGRLDVPVELQLPCHRKSNGHRHLDVFGRLWWDRPSGTITAMFDNFTRGRFAHPAEHRNITGREGARLQSFPDTFRFIGPKKDVARQIGNAVPPLLAQAMGEALALTLTNEGRLSNNMVERVDAVA